MNVMLSNKACVLFLPLLSFILIRCGEPASIPSGPVGSHEFLADSTYLRHVKEVEWPRAYATHDTLLLDRILGDDFVLIDQDGNWFSKQDELAWIKKNAVRHDSFRYEIRRLDILPNGTALVCGTGHIQNDSVRSEYQSSNIFIKRDGIWKAVQSHVSGVKDLE